MSKVRRSTGVALTTVFALSLGAQCVVGQEMKTAQMACCVATDHDCQGAAAVEDCCQSERAEQEQLVEQIQRLVPPPAVVMTTISALVRLPDTHFGFYVVSTTELKAASPPKYVLLGSFLI